MTKEEECEKLITLYHSGRINDGEFVKKHNSILEKYATKKSK